MANRRRGQRGAMLIAFSILLILVLQIAAPGWLMFLLGCAFVGGFARTYTLDGSGLRAAAQRTS